MQFDDIRIFDFAKVCVNASRIPWRWGGAEGRLKEDVALLV